MPDTVLQEEPLSCKHHIESSRKSRRRVVYVTLLFCAFLALYVTFNGEDTRLNETIILSSFALAGSVIGFYIGGAAYQDTRIATRARD